MLDHGLRDCLLEFAAALIGFWSIQLHDLRNTAAGVARVGVLVCPSTCSLWVLNVRCGGQV
jgi:hypothetical protein